VRVYEVQQNGQTQPKVLYSHEAPVLSVCWNKVRPQRKCPVIRSLMYVYGFACATQDGSKILSGGADKAGRCFDVTTGQPTQVAAHNEPIRSVRWVEAEGGLLATASWDKTVKVGRFMASYSLF
jgi:mRNA export factor